MEDKDKEEAEDSENENLRDLILQQLANLEPSDVSDDDSYKVRLSCILEDDESESSGGAQKEFPKHVEKGSERNKESEKGPPKELESLIGVQLSESMYDSELSDEFACENVQITDLDDVTLCDPPKEKTEDAEMEKTEENEETSDELGKDEGFAIKKLKSSDNVHKRPFIVKRRELSSDSSDLDISITNSADGASSDLKIVEINEMDDENTLNIAPDNVFQETEMSLDDLVGKPKTEETKAVERPEKEEKKTMEAPEKKETKAMEAPEKKDMKAVEAPEKKETKVIDAPEKKETKAMEPPEKKKTKVMEAPEKKETKAVEEPEEEEEPKGYEKSGELEVVDNETLSMLFAKVSRTYLEKTKSNVKWEENEKIEKMFGEAIEERARARAREMPPGDHLSFQDVHIRGTSPKEYNPPVPPETYLWEELKRLRERGGYPWTYLDKPPFDEATWKKYMEHVYEPINPPPLSAENKSEPHQEEGTKKTPPAKVSSIPETEKQTLRVPSESESHSKAKDSGDDSKDLDDMEVEEISSAQEIQDRLESRFLAESPSATSATTASQSRTDVTSSVLDTSGFEDLPVKQGPLGKTRRDQMRAQAQDIQQKLRNHAGRIRNKFSTMPRPSIGRKERAAKEPSEKPKFRLPEMHAPKINLPDTSKFKFPEKAKFHLPESAKFHLPETSKFHLPDRSTFHLPEKGKFHLPERPKFHFAERAKLHLPEKAKFHFPEKAKFHLPEKGKFHLPEKGKFHLPEKGKFHLPEKAKFHLPERPKFHIPEKAKFHLPDKSKFHLPEKAKFTLPNRPKLEFPGFGRTTRETDSSPSSSKSRFDFKSYPKLFTKQAKDYMTSSPKQTRGRTPPPRMKQDEAPPEKGSEKWMQKLEDLQYADDDLDESGIRETDSRKSEKSESEMFDFRDRDLGDMEDFAKMPPEVRTLSTKSSASRLSDKELQDSESSDGRKKGVLEEINSDEFFLRQKGISQDDIDMGKYLSREIREAFRSPDVNALARLDYVDADDENVDLGRYQMEPKRPKRTGSIKKKSILKHTSTSNPSIAEDGYKTYPPRRPGRKSRSQSKSLLNEEAVISESVSRYENAPEDADVNLSKYDNVEDYEEDNVSEYYKTPGPAKEYQHYKVPRSHAPYSPSPPVKRKSSLENENSSKRIHEGWGQVEELHFGEPPKPVARRKHQKKAAREMESTVEEQIPQEITQEPEEVVPEPQILESPVPPKRTRTRSSGSRSLRSLPTTEGDVNSSFQSEPGRERLEQIKDETILVQREPIEESHLVKSSSEFMSPRAHEYEVTDLDDIGFGYAIVGKPTATKPERQKKQKPERPPPPRRKKEISMPTYSTYPRRTPARPLRNYSTLGPSRPPRRRKSSLIDQAIAERQFRTYAEIQNRHFDKSLDSIEVSGSSKDLQTDKVIEKMKGRPLPPPPRPPRQKSKGPEEDLEPTEEEKISLSILREDEFPIERKVMAFVHEPPAEKEMIEEICTATQTDPLPEDFSFEGEDGSEMIQEFSHEQLRIQQAFLEEMKKEEEEMRERGRTNESQMVDAELKAEVIRQIEDIIAEEKRILEERKNERRVRSEDSGQKSETPKTGRSYLDVDSDMGYASLERRGHRQEPQPPSLREISPKMEKLQVKDLEVENLSVHEVQADQIFVKELQGNRIASQDVDNTGGNMVLGNVELSPSFIQQIVDKIPWDTIRQEQNIGQPAPETPSTFPQPPTRPQRRQRGAQPQEDSDDESLFQPRKTHRRHHRPQYSSDEEDRRERRQLIKYSESSRGIPELSLQLARACTSAGARALTNFVQSNAAIAQSLDRELCVQAILCIAIALIAGFFLFGYDAKIVHLHRWNFQFPPQPPHDGF